MKAMRNEVKRALELSVVIAFFYLCVECGRRIRDTGIFFRSLRGGLDLLL